MDEEPPQQQGPPADARPHGARCVCQICECGRHRCPRDFQYIKEDPKSTEYKDKYPGWRGIGRLPPFVPPRKPMNEGQPLSDVTTFRASYPGHKPQKEIAAKKQEYQPPTQPMDGLTNYRAEYTPKDGARGKSLKPIWKYRPNQDPVSNTLYRDEYRQYGSDEMGGARGKSTKKVLPYEKGKPMEQLTTQRGDFVNHGSQPIRGPFLPNKTDWSNSGPLDGNTVYAMTYRGEGGEKAPSCRPRAAWEIPNVPMRTDTTQRVDYVPRDGAKRKSFAPDRQFKPPTASMDDVTTCRASYGKPDCVERPKWPAWAIHKVYETPTAKMDTGTLYRSEYIPKTICPAKSMKPAYRYQYKTGDAPNSLYRLDFHDYPGVKPPSSYKIVKPYEKPQIDMANTTEQRDRFTGQPGERRDSFRPPRKPDLGNQPLDGTTTYRVEYVPKPVTICPATQIPLNPIEMRQPGVKSETNKGTFEVIGPRNGHLFYNKVTA